MSNLVELVKQAAVEAVDAGKPTVIVFGTVIAASPLQIQIDQKIILEAGDLILTRHITNHTVNMQFGDETEVAGSHEHVVNTSGGSGSALPAGGHVHSYGGTLPFRVLGALKVGERVLMCRVQGGKKYVVIDRLEG